MPHTKQSDFKGWAMKAMKMFILAQYLQDFEPNYIEELPDEWIIELVGTQDRIPEAVQGKEVVFDGYYRSIDILTHSFSLKKIYLRLIRRRWKEKGSIKSYCNEYGLRIPGMKSRKC
jgi:hypothetical protein